MVFFLNAEGKVYARYGGRDAESPDSRQSLAGLRYTMQAVLRTHAAEEQTFAPRSGTGSRTIREVAGSRRRGRCFHCHNVKEVLDANLRRTGKWAREMAWRYPLPENVGLELEIDRGNVVKTVKRGTPAAAAGLRAGDVLQRLNGVPIHSFADAQLALDRAPRTGSIEAAWRRDGTTARGSLALPDGWRRTDISWRPSMQRWVPTLRLRGVDLTAAEKKALGLPAKQLAFRQQDPIPPAARTAGIRAGDVVIGIDGTPLDMDADDFFQHVQRHYLVGDRVPLTLLRDGKRVHLAMPLLR